MKLDQIICLNRKATFDYHVRDKYVAGLVLKGNEVKPVRNKKCNISQAYVSFQHGRPVIYGMSIDADANACMGKFIAKSGFLSTSEKYDAKRVRYLLLHKREINKLIGKIQEEGLTLIPLKIMISSSGYVKVEFGVCQGKKMFDKRAALKEKELNEQARNAKMRF